MGFDSTKYWADRYAKGGDSGAGSKNHLARYKSLIVTGILEQFKCTEVAELGCGDGMQISDMLEQLNLIRVKYHGFDISEPVVKGLQEKFLKEMNICIFLMSELDTFENRYEATLSMDVIYHLVEDKVFEEYMNKLFDHSKGIVIIYSSNHEDNEGSAEWVRHRQFDWWIIKNRPDWRLYRKINNPFPWNKKLDRRKARTTSVSNFYIYVKNT